jgi:hypothetical protein
MGLVSIIDRLESLVIGKASVSEIKPVLILLRDQAKATELRLRKSKLDAKAPKYKAEIVRLNGIVNELKKKALKVQKKALKIQPKPLPPYPSRPKDVGFS